EHLGDTQARAYIAIIVREVALQHPDAITQPLNEGHVVGAPPNQRLGQVYMRVDQAGDDKLALDIDDFILVMLLEEDISFTNGYNAIVFDGDCAIGDNVSCGVHGDDGGIGEYHETYSPILRMLILSDFAFSNACYHSITRYGSHYVMINIISTY